jgi:hypothetical protein
LVESDKGSAVTNVCHDPQGLCIVQRCARV